MIRKAESNAERARFIRALLLYTKRNTDKREMNG